MPPPLHPECIRTFPMFHLPLRAARLLLLIATAISLRAVQLPDGKPHQFTLSNGQFQLDGKPFKLVAGEIHPVRILPEFWETRIKQARAMGLNALSIYVMWNRIEPTDGAFDFAGHNDVKRIARLCQENGLWLIVRPGPYVNAEWDWGGLPFWLRTKKITKLRGMDAVMLDYTRRYINRLGQEIAALQVNHGGPILMVQVENEYRVKVDEYMNSLVAIFRQAGFDGQLFANGLAMKSRLEDWHIPGVLNGIDGMVQSAGLLAKCREASAITGYPLFSPECYTSWYSKWGSKIPRKPVSSELANLNWFFTNDVSFCYYMFCGGTNFGFTSMPTCATSYDYDAPVDELGRIRPKYTAIRDYLAKALQIDLPPVPADPTVISIDRFQVSPRCALLDILPGKPLIAEQPLDFEHLGVFGGFVHYRTRLTKPVAGDLDLSRAKDYSVVMIDGKTVGTTYARYGKERTRVRIQTTGPATLDILVHSLGRENASMAEGGRGLLAAPSLDGKPLTGWEMTPLPLDDPGLLPAGTPIEGSPMFYTGSFSLTKTGETFLDLSQFSFGAVWVNGHNLGRYWEVGATRSLYLPSPWQKVGENRITVLDLLPKTGAKCDIRGTMDMIETEPIPFPANSK